MYTVDPRNKTEGRSLMATKSDLEIVEEVVADFLRAAAPDLAVQTVHKMLRTLKSHHESDFRIDGAIVALRRLAETSNAFISEIEKKVGETK